MELSSFSFQYSWLLWATFVLMALAIICFEWLKKSFPAIVLLMMGAFALLSYFALSDPFLHVWDEQFHALVAKNIQYHFLKPTLLENPVLSYTKTEDYSWVETNIWLHKQPLFLWQIALSFKFFGVSYFTLRLPSILLFTLIVPLIYRMGKIVKNAQIGFYAAFLFLSGSYLIQLSSGRLATDHNDAAFIFYTTASFWAWLEYRKATKWYWLPLIGIFSGAAILVKWLTGLIVFAGWGVYVLMTQAERKQKRAWMDIVIAFMFTLITFLPWQIYTFNKYPEIITKSYEINNQHLKLAVHGHSGDWNYHFIQWSDLVGNGSQWIVLVILLIVPFLKLHRHIKISFMSWFIIVHGFFMLVPTKMPAFTLIVAPLAVLLFTYIFFELIEFIKNSRVKSLIIPVFFIAFYIYCFDRGEIKGKNPNWSFYAKEAAHFSQIDKLNLPENSIFFNFNYFGDIRFLFSTHYLARIQLPIEEDIQKLKDMGYTIFVFDNGELPQYILHDKSVAKIKVWEWPENLSDTIEIYR